MNQLIFRARLPEPKNNMVESIQFKEDKKLSVTSRHQHTQFDLMGLTWVFFEEEW